MHKVLKDFTDGLTKEFHKVGDLIEVLPWRVEALGDFIQSAEYFKKKMEPETEMLEVSENAMLPKPKNKGIKNH